MAVTVVLNGTSYSIPEPGDTAWGQDLTDYFVAQATGLLQKAGGTFTLTAEVDFGATYGLKSTYFKSRGSNVSTTGIMRLANAESLSWRNAANSADLALKVNASNLLEFNGTAIQPAGNYITALTGDVTATGPGSVAATIAANAVSDAKFRQSAACSLVGRSANSTGDVADISAASNNTVLKRVSDALAFASIVNADIDAAAAIAYSKLNLSGSIVNADVNAAAAIAYSKLNLSGSIVNADVNAAAAIAYSKLNLADSIVNADIAAAAAIARSKIANGTADHVLINSGAGAMSSEAQLATSRGGTGLSSYASGDLIYASAANVLSALAKGSDGQVLKLSSGLPVWAGATAALAVTSKTTTYNATSSDDVIQVDGSGGAWPLGLPAAASNSGKVFYIVRTDNTPANAVTIDPNGAETIDGYSTYGLYTQYESLVIVSNGTNWIVLSHFAETEWTSYTPTLTGWGTPTNVNYLWKRFGDTLFIRAFHTNGTVAAVTASASLPASATIDTGKMYASQPSVFGNWIRDISASGSGKSGFVITSPTVSSTLLYFSIGDAGVTGSPFNPLNGSSTSDNTNNFSWIANGIPIVGWKP